MNSAPSDDSAACLQVDVAIVGGGPAGLMAAELLSESGSSVHVFDSMPTVGRKFLLAGIGGLNLTHAEPFEQFVTRFGERVHDCRRWLDGFGPNDVRQWAATLGVETFVGTSQRVFPSDMKAAPLLRAWLHRLKHPATGRPVVFHMRHRWGGVLQQQSGGWHLSFQGPAGEREVRAQAVVLALGGGSWARLGSDGAWQPWLMVRGVSVHPLCPANCGFDVQVQPDQLGWSAHLVSRFAGQPLKNVLLRAEGAAGTVFQRKGEFVLTATGIEGSLVYAASALLRDMVTRQGHADLSLDFKPDSTLEQLTSALQRPRAGKTLSAVLKGRLGLSAPAVGLLHEVLEKSVLADPQELAAAIKCLPLRVVATRPLDEAISSAGGVALEALTPDLMVRELPGVFCAGEMLDWEAPTGGYLLTACLASGRLAGQGVQDYLRSTM